MKVPVRIHRSPILLSFRIACVRLLFLESLQGLFVLILELSSRIMKGSLSQDLIYCCTSSGISPRWKLSKDTIRQFIHTSPLFALLYLGLSQSLHSYNKDFLYQIVHVF